MPIFVFNEGSLYMMNWGVYRSEQFDPTNEKTARYLASKFPHIIYFFAEIVQD